ncbi:hypothetical protein HELRODRAFT_162532 [Helobdella robusta]|uniref:Uncharacterized protein n=1 Tax=Helobdella robusta TaxID=6412 RepID=T1EST1_HELRO|nr:hypothetical protein HELRODRAFT_162532 [Helobdella robusta]ESN99053.1 hypothetical protein HELRODRAFT_162532 [Helobdella robusta]
MCKSDEMKSQTNITNKICIINNHSLLHQLASSGVAGRNDENTSKRKFNKPTLTFSTNPTNSCNTNPYRLGFFAEIVYNKQPDLLRPLLLIAGSVSNYELKLDMNIGSVCTFCYIHPDDVPHLFYCINDPTHFNAMNF